MVKNILPRHNQARLARKKFIKSFTIVFRRWLRYELHSKYTGSNKLYGEKYS